MMLTLDNFEKTLDPTILKKGNQYYKNDQVTELEEDDGIWTATVIGSDYYTVTVETDKSGELAIECDCPYDWGPYCKHAAAVLFAIRDMQAEPQHAPKAEPKQTVKTLLEKLTREQLIEIVLDQTRKDKLLANNILLKYGTESLDKTMFVRIIENALRAGRDHGFLDYMGARRAAKSILTLLDQAEQQIAEGQPAKAIPVLQAIVETVSEALNSDADDSAGELGGCVDGAFNALEEAAPMLSSPDKQALFDYCLAQMFNKNYAWFDYDWASPEIARRLVETEQQRAALFSALDRKIEKDQRMGRMSEYTQEQALEIKLEVMEKLGDSAETIQNFLKQHLHLHRIRQKVVQQLIDAGDFDAANTLCIEAIKRYTNQNYPGLVKEYREFLLDIARKSNNTDGVVRLSQELFLETREFQHYDLLKHTIKAETWPDFVKKLIQTIQTQADLWRKEDLLAEIYVREEMWSALLKLAQPDKVSVITKYKNHLHSIYPEECCDIYERVIHRDMDSATSRDGYKVCAELLARIRELGEEERAEIIKAALIKRYPKRRAMIEELNRI